LIARRVDKLIVPPSQTGDPGLGVEFDRTAARAHPFRVTEPFHLRRVDGSFTN
jgi:hypothetical protein